MSRKVIMGSRSWVVASLLLLAFCLCDPAVGWPNNGLPMVPQEASNPIDYLNMMGVRRHPRVRGYGPSAWSSPSDRGLGYNPLPIHR